MLVSDFIPLTQNVIAWKVHEFIVKRGNNKCVLYTTRMGSVPVLGGQLAEKGQFQK